MFSGFLEPHKQVKSMEKEKKPMGFDHQPADTPYLLAFNYGFLANLNKCLKGPIFNTGILHNNIYLFISLIMFLSVHIEIFGIFVKRFKSDFNLLLTKHYNESVFFFTQKHGLSYNSIDIRRLIYELSVFVNSHNPKLYFFRFNNIKQPWLLFLNIYF